MSTQVKDLTKQEYDLIRRLVYAKSGINLGEQKMQLVRSRLGKTIRQGGFRSYREYIHHVESDSTGAALSDLLDSISTNTTHLFREMRHFTLLSETIRRWVNDKSWRLKYSTVRIWSAGCSSGEEPYSLAMTAHNALSGHPKTDVMILATDLSTQVLAKAKVGMFEEHKVGTVPPNYRQRYLRKVVDNGKPMVQVIPEIRRLISFSRFNLMQPTFPFKQGFDIIFCRNVMIYFDSETQEKLVAKYAGQLHPGGYLMIGHSESLNTIQHGLSYVEPTVYEK